MGRITYEPSMNFQLAMCRVLLDGRLVGFIRPTKADNGYFYVTTTGTCGPVYPTVTEVKQSLEI